VSCLVCLHSRLTADRAFVAGMLYAQIARDEELGGAVTLGLCSIHSDWLVKGLRDEALARLAEAAVTRGVRF